MSSHNIILSMLEKIKSPKDLKKIPINDLNKLAKEMREALLNRVSKFGGHIAPNFGTVEAIIAYHYVFNGPTDKIVFDVSHQSYPHKLLTGRAFGFIDDSKFHEISGYTNPNESKHDLFAIGHTSTSISLAIGLAKARDLKKQKYNVTAFIGDGSLSGGEALEGLNAAYELHSNLIIIVNDNDMCIAENHGGLYEHLKHLRQTNGKSSTNIFKDLKFDYYFVKNGNNIKDLITTFKKVKDHKKPVVVHICTQKGKGLIAAEKNRELWHSGGPFDPKTFKYLAKPQYGYANVISEYMLDKAKKDKDFIALACGSPGSSGMNLKVRKQLGKQYMDIGIAEQSAAAIASGIATNGGKPLWPICSTFIQRAYDQISQDICINNSPVAVLILYAGINGMKDVTHLGFFDIPLLSNIPNLVYIVPYTKQEFIKALNYAVDQKQHPVFIRVPCILVNGKQCNKDFSKINKYEVVTKGKDVAIIGLGECQTLATKVSEYLKKDGINPTIINPFFASGIDKTLLTSLIEKHKLVITIEDGVIDGGFGQKISSFYANKGIKVINYGYKKEFVDRFDINKFLKQNRMTPDLIYQDILKNLK